MKISFSPEAKKYASQTLEWVTSWGRSAYKIIRKYPKTFGFIGALSFGTYITAIQQEAVNHEHSRLNHAFQVADVSVKIKWNLSLEQVSIVHVLISVETFLK